MSKQAEQIDAAATSMKAEMNSERRKQEALHGAMLCCGKNGECQNEAAKNSCYCDACEALEFADE